jgi:FAD:protein FMN transferase
VRLEAAAGGFAGHFEAMASPCTVLIEGAGEALARQLLQLACDEAQRIERKFSRYRSDSVVASLHASRGQPVTVDDETAGLLDYAAQCHALSEGRFDITTGVLRQAWRFDGGSHLPTAQAVAALLPRVGWQRVGWQRPQLQLPEGMELDFGGIGKEYAVDRVLDLLDAHARAEASAGNEPDAAPVALLVNFGGDLACNGPRRSGQPWQVGIEGIEAAPPAAAAVLGLAAGGLATSGDSRRFLLKDGVRYGHVLDPLSGWPVRGAPRSVTVAAGRCSEAGVLATLALLQGPEAGRWLAQQGLPHWVQW